METQKNDEKNIVLELKHQLGRMMVQVDYMYRNDREMSRLDLDIMMERTRDLYDLLCDYQAGEYHHSPVDEVEEEPRNTEINEGGELINRDVDFEIETPVSPKNDPNFCDDEHEIHNPEMIDETPDTIDAEPTDEPAATVDGTSDEPVETPDETPVGANYDSPAEISDEPVAEDEDEDWEDEDDQPFHVEEPEDNSLAAKLQRAHVSDIRLALGINDKVMIINELFMGSVERYNKSIDALNDFPTLSGARVYMSELQIELQWDTESQAYKMLNDLVERRFV